MNKYTWDFYEIRDNYNKLLNKLNKCKDKEEYEFLEESINTYKKLLYVNSKRKTNKEDIIIGKDLPIFYDDFIKKVASFYEGNNPDYIDLLTGCYPIIKKNYNEELDINYSIAFNNDELMEIVLDFFNKMTPKDFYLKVKKLLETNKTFLNITYSKTYGYQDNVTIFSKELKKKYSLITRHNDLIDIMSIPHEITHYLLNDYDFYEYLKSDSKFLLEVDGCLINLLVSEYYKKYSQTLFTNSYDLDGKPVDDSLFFKHKMLGDIKEFTERFIIKNEFLLSLDDDMKLDNDTFYKRTKRFNLINPYEDYLETIEYLCSNEIDDLKYGLDYLIAMDLYTECLKDPEKAFNDLINIKKKKRIKNLIPYLENNNITFMNDNYKNLKKYIKNMTN